MSKSNYLHDKPDNDKKPPLIGAHLSITGGFHKLSERMDEIGATCCAFFLKNQRRFSGKPIDTKDIEIFRLQYFNDIDPPGCENIPASKIKFNEENNLRIAREPDIELNQNNTQVNEQKSNGYQKANEPDEKNLRSKKVKSEQDNSKKEEIIENKTTSHVKPPISTNKQKNIDILVPHASYLINMANATDKRESHLSCFFDELERCKLLGIKYLNIHPGSDTSNLGIEKASQLIADAINEGHKKNETITILLENMAGQGKVLCSRFEEIKKIIDKVDDKERIGICIDTAHLFGAGHDIRTKEEYEKVITQIDETIGLQYVKAMHLNDSLVELNSKKDRHARIGCGHIGKDAFRFIMRDNRFAHIPKILETPDETKYAQEIALLKKFANEKS